MSLSLTLPEPVLEYRELCHHPAWIERRDFIKQVRDKLRAHNVYNRYVDTVMFAKSLPFVDVRWKDLKTTEVCAQLVRHPEQENCCVIILNTRKSSKAQQFDCAHELIHFWFHTKHPEDEQQERIYEIQANWGAREIKMPEMLFCMTVVSLCKRNNINLLSELSNRFNVGKTAVKYRIEDLFRTKILDRYFDKQGLQNLRLAVLWDTDTNPDFKSNATEMGICMKSQRAKAIGEVDAQGRCLVCPRCGNTKFRDEEDTNYCRRCGLYRRNDCLRCEKPNEPDAAFCEYCGANTVWQNAGLIQSWQEENCENNSTDIPPAPDDVPF